MSPRGQPRVTLSRARTLEVYRLAEGRWLLLATHEAQVRAEPFEAVELDLAPLWG
jgi:hypothetical protein